MVEIVNPRYGKIGDLCSYLGYDPKGVRPEESEAFRTGLIAFRKSYIETHGIADFPFHITALAVRQCAEEYLVIKGVKAFPNSYDDNVLCYPRDRNKIFDTLVKLFCQQEYKFRENHAYLNQRNASKEDTFADDEPRPFKNPCAFSEGPEQTVSSIPHPARTNIGVDDQSRQDRVLFNTRIHLDWVYPLEEQVLEKPTAWLTLKRLRVERIHIIDPFAIRYLHERSLYCVQANSTEIKKFSRDAYRQYRRTPEEQSLVHVEARCKRLIKTIVKYFNQDGYGFLYNENGVKKKTKEFETAWLLRRTQWLEKWHQGSSQNVIECLDKSSLSINIKRKRSSLHNNDPIPPDYSQAYAYAKRTRTQGMVIGEDLVNPPCGQASDLSQSERDIISHNPTSLHQNPLVSNATSLPSWHFGNSPTSKPFRASDSHPAHFDMGVSARSQGMCYTPQSDTDISELSQIIEESAGKYFEGSMGRAPVAQMSASTKPPGANNTPTTSFEDEEDDPDFLFTPLGSGPDFFEPQVSALHERANASKNVSEISQPSTNQPRVSPVSNTPNASLNLRLGSPTASIPAELNTPLPTATKEPLPLTGTQSPPPNPVAIDNSLNVVLNDAQPSVAKPRIEDLAAPTSSSAYRHSGPFPGSRQSLLPTKEETTTLVKLSSSPKKPRLVFAIEDETRTPDNEPESLFSKKFMFQLNIKDLFTLVCNKSGIDLVDLQQISFQNMWDSGGLIVSKSDGEKQWIRKQNKLAGGFMNGQKEFPDMMEFEVWVYCGDRVTRKKAVSQREANSEDD